MCGTGELPVIPGHREAMSPESRDSGFDALHRPGMTVNQLPAFNALSISAFSTVSTFSGVTGPTSL